MSTPAFGQPFTRELRQWILAQAAAGCRQQDMLRAMARSGWQADAARDALSEMLQPVPALPSRRPAPGEGLKVRTLLTLEHPHLHHFGGLLSEAECAGLVRLARPRLARALTLDAASGAARVHAVRTGESAAFGRAETPLIDRLEQRVATLLNWPARLAEGLQVMRYGPGAQYRPHYDYLDPADPGAAALLRRGRQRVATLLIYLNTPAQGGATVLPDADLEVAPVRGNALFFGYDRPHPATRTLHGSAPVIAGEKWVAVKWLLEDDRA